MPITLVPAWPARNDPLFNSKAEATLGSLTAAINDLNTTSNLAQLSTTTTSSSSVLIGTGSRTFTVPAGLGFAVGMTLRIANTSANFMTGDVTSYTSTTLIVNVTAVTGAGTFASWAISMAAVGANTAASVSNTPAGNIAATNVQAALNELDSEKLSNAAGAVTSTNLNSIITAGTVGSATKSAVVTFDAKGRATAISDVDKITSGTAVATTSGTSIDFTSIPANAKRITLMFTAVSTTGLSGKLIQLGTSGGVQLTGYDGGSQMVQQATGFSGLYSSAGFPINSTIATDALSGAIVFTLLSASSNIWVAQGTYRNSTSQTGYVAGSVSLSAVLDRVRLTTINGTDTFDAGLINILIE